VSKSSEMFPVFSLLGKLFSLVAKLVQVDQNRDIFLSTYRVSKLVQMFPVFCV
jgi:hypothetical protein